MHQLDMCLLYDQLHKVTMVRWHSGLLELDGSETLLIKPYSILCYGPFHL